MVLQTYATLTNDESELELLTVGKRYLDPGAFHGYHVQEAILFRHSYVSRDSISSSNSPVFVKPRHDFMHPHPHVTIKI